MGLLGEVSFGFGVVVWSPMGDVFRDHGLDTLLPWD
jgi:hypothetical protein